MTPEDARRQLIDALQAISDRFHKGADDWERSLLPAFREYCRAIDIEPGLLLPLEKVISDTADRTRRAGHGRPPMLVSKASALAYAAAAVTSLHRRNKQRLSIPKAAEIIATLSGIDCETLMKFRDEISRGKAPKEALDKYPVYLAELESGDELTIPWVTSYM